MALPLIAILASALDSSHPKQIDLAEFIQAKMLPGPPFSNFEVSLTSPQVLTMNFDFDERDDNGDLINCYPFRARFRPVWAGIEMDLWCLKGESPIYTYEAVYDLLYDHMIQKTKVVVEGDKIWAVFV